MSDPHTGRRYNPLRSDYTDASDGITVDIWLPHGIDGREEGEFIVDAANMVPSGMSSDGKFLLDGISSLERFQNHTAMGAVLRRLGLTAWTHVNNQRKGRGFGRMNFAPIPEIVDRAADFNQTLPPSHKIPTLARWHGAVIPAEEYIAAWSDDTILLADGEGKADGPMYVGHDISFHLPARLALDPRSRKVPGNLSRAVLALPANAQCPVAGYTDETIWGYFTISLDSLGSAAAVAADDFASISTPSSFERPAGEPYRGSAYMLRLMAQKVDQYNSCPDALPLAFTPPTEQQCRDLGEACVQHVAILGMYARREN